MRSSKNLHLYMAVFVTCFVVTNAAIINIQAVSNPKTTQC
jgi:hypothetical protein